MERIERFAKLGDFIPHGDDSFIDDQGITNRWAEGRRQRRAAQAATLEQIRQRAEQHTDAGLERLLIAQEEDRRHMLEQAIADARAVGAGGLPIRADDGHNLTEEELDHELDEIMRELETDT